MGHKFRAKGWKDCRGRSFLPERAAWWEFVERGRSRNKFADGEVLRQPDSREAGSSRSLETRATGDGERGKHVGAVLLGGLHGAGRRGESPAVWTIEVRVWNVRMRR